jgi:hypothetical protein
MLAQVFSILGALIVFAGFIMLQLGKWGPKDPPYLDTVLCGSAFMCLAAGLVGNYGFIFINAAFIVVALYNLYRS